MTDDNVPFLDLSAATAELRMELSHAAQRVIDSGWYILGPEVEAFETAWAGYCQAEHAIGLSNGLDALVLALKALGVGPGDEVVVPSHTFVATWLAVAEVGATIVPVDVDPETLNIDCDLIEAAITDRTRVLLPVHLYGQPADLTRIMAIAARHDLRVIEDAAQAHGARWDGRRAGAVGDLVCWSFYPGKNLGALGDAGAITTNDAALAERVAMLRNYGSRAKYEHLVIGGNSRLDPIQAAMLSVKLAHIDDWNRRRRSVAARYDDAFANTPLRRQTVAQPADPVWHLYTVRHPARDDLKAKLDALGIGTLIHYPIAPHMQQAFAPLGFRPDQFPVTQETAASILSLPMGPHLSDSQIDRVIEAVGMALAGLD